jgi:hypothetical protein
MITTDESRLTYALSRTIKKSLLNNNRVLGSDKEDT